MPDYLDYYRLYHHGIKGQKWGIRRFQNEDGTLTAEGRQRYEVDSSGRMSERGKAIYKMDHKGYKKDAKLAAQEARRQERITKAKASSNVGATAKGVAKGAAAGLGVGGAVAGGLFLASAVAGMSTKTSSLVNSLNLASYGLHAVLKIPVAVAIGAGVGGTAGLAKKKYYEKQKTNE